MHAMSMTIALGSRADLAPGEEKERGLKLFRAPSGEPGLTQDILAVGKLEALTKYFKETHGGTPEEIEADFAEVYIVQVESAVIMSLLK